MIVLQQMQDGYDDRTVLVDPKDIAAVQPASLQMLSTACGSRIFLRSGDKFEVMEPPSKVRQMLEEAPTKTQITPHDFNQQHICNICGMSELEFAMRMQWAACPKHLFSKAKE